MESVMTDMCIKSIREVNEVGNKIQALNRREFDKVVYTIHGKVKEAVKKQLPHVRLAQAQWKLWSSIANGSK